MINSTCLCRSMSSQKSTLRSINAGGQAHINFFGYHLSSARVRRCKNCRTPTWWEISKTSRDKEKATPFQKWARVRLCSGRLSLWNRLRSLTLREWVTRLQSSCLSFLKSGGTWTPRISERGTAPKTMPQQGLQPHSPSWTKIFSAPRSSTSRRTSRWLSLV